MNQRLPLLILLLLTLMGGKTHAQPAKVDSLEQVLKLHRTNDTVRVNLLNQIAYSVYTTNADKTRSYATQADKLSDKLHFRKGKAESLRLIGISYANSDEAKALAYFQSALKVSEETNYQIGIIKCLNSIGITFGNRGMDARAIGCYKKAIRIAEAINNPLEKAKCLINISKTYTHQGNANLAIQAYTSALILLEEQGETQLMANCYNSLGYLYIYKGNYPLALECYQKCLKISEAEHDKYGSSVCLISIGGIYSSQKNYKKALEFYQRALKIGEAISDKATIAGCLVNIGSIYQKANSVLALGYLQRALAYSEELQMTPLNISSLICIGDFHKKQNELGKALGFYHSALKLSEAKGIKLTACQSMNQIGLIYFTQQRYTDALSYARKSLAMANELKLLKEQTNLHDLFSGIYAATGNYKEALEHQVLFKALNDSVFNEGNVKRITELEYSYKYEKEKQALVLEQQKKDMIQTAAKRQQRIVMLSFIGAFLLVSLLAIFVYRSYRIKRQSNILLTQQKQEIEAKNEDLVQLNEEISAQREEITAQRDEIEAQRDMVVLQRDHMEVQKEKITDSIDYAQHIQQALLPSTVYATANLGEHFILFKPKDVVSGDFYWCTRINEYLIVTVADCTGHGVPGAFMSMLGISFLNEIVGKKGVVRASEILDQLRKSVIDALQQKWQTGEQKDGMDMALIVINTQTAQLQYAGAQNPLYMVTAGNELRTIKGDNQTVAINNEMKPFTNHEIALSKGDCIYLATDGYHDQFGGPANKKFKGKQLKDLFVSISEKPMAEQLVILDNAFESWRGSGEQIDDVTILGMRI